jgi:predicted alpha/beta hydrolase
MTSRVVDSPLCRAHAADMTTSRTAPSVLISPAMAVPSRYYRPLVECLTDVAGCVDTVSRRGIGDGSRRASRGNDWSYADEADDLAAAVVRARTERPERPVLVLGHSLGAHLCAILGRRADGSSPDALVTVAASVPWFRHYPRGGLVEYATGIAVPVVTAAVGHWPTPGFGAPAPRTLMREWARMVRTGVTPFDDGPPIRIPTLAVRLDGDRLVTPAAADHFERCVDPDALSSWTYTLEQCPPGGSAGHVLWVRSPAVIVEHIMRWWAGDQVPAGPTREAAREPARRNVSATAYTTPSTASPIIDA